MEILKKDELLTEVPFGDMKRTKKNTEVEINMNEVNLEL